jgi:hypothetical protein
MLMHLHAQSALLLTVAVLASKSSLDWHVVGSSRAADGEQNCHASEKHEGLKSHGVGGQLRG